MPRTATAAEALYHLCGIQAALDSTDGKPLARELQAEIDLFSALSQFYGKQVKPAREKAEGLSAADTLVLAQILGQDR